MNPSLHHRPGAAAGLRRAVGAFFLRDLRVSVSYRLPFLIEIVSTFVAVLTMFFVAKIVDPGLIPGGYFTFVVLGLALVAFLDAGVATVGANLREEQLLGTLEATLGSGIPVGSLAAGMAAYPMVNATFSAVVFLLLSIPFGLSAPGANWPLMLVSTVVGVVAFVGIGLVGAAIVLVIRRAAGAIAWIVTAMTLVAGQLFPPELLPGWMKALSALSPFTWCLRLVRGAAIEGWGWSRAWPALGILAVQAVIYLGIGVASLAAGMRHARRAGTLGSY